MTQNMLSTNCTSSHTLTPYSILQMQCSELLVENQDIYNIFGRKCPKTSEKQKTKCALPYAFISNLISVTHCIMSLAKNH